MKLDRAFRSSMDTHQGIAHLQDHRVDFVAITQPIDTTTSTGKLQLAILAAMAEFERDLIVERTKEGMARARDSRFANMPHLPFLPNSSSSPDSLATQRTRDSERCVSRLSTTKCHRVPSDLAARYTPYHEANNL